MIELIVFLVLLARLLKVEMLGRKGKSDPGPKVGHNWIIARPVSGL